MTSGGLNAQPIAPTVLIVPHADSVSGCAYEANAMSGSLLSSGGNLYIMAKTGWEIVGAQDGTV